MVFRSTRESIEKQEISVLAVIETICSVALYLWIARNVVHSWTPIVVAVCAAPFLLLRTDQSTERGLRWYDASFQRIVNVFFVDKVFESLDKLPDVIVTLLFIMIMFLVTLLAALLSPAIRILSITVTALQHPLISLGAIPRNWVQLTLCTDFFYPPEIMQGIESSKYSSLRMLRIRGLITELRDSREWLEKLFFTIMLVPLLIISLPYRYSLKSTAIVWLPLLWIVPKAQTDKPFSTRLKFLNKSSWGRFVALLSGFNILAFITKIALFNAVHAFAQWWNSLNVASLVHQFVEPFTVPWWQVAGVLNSILGLILYFRASDGLILLEESEKNESDLRRLDITIRTGTVIRAVLSLYTISCLLYIIVSQIPSFNWPQIGKQLFPWL